MGRVATALPSTPFGEWLNEIVNQRGIERKSVAIKADIGKTSVTQLINGERKPSKEMVQRLAAALVPADADPEYAHRLLQEGLKAAGFAYDLPDYDEDEDIAFFRGLPTDQRQKALKVWKAMFDEDDAKADAGNIGKRAED